MSEDSIKKLYIEPTSKCNLNCSICFRNSWINEELGMMDIDIAKKLWESIRFYSGIEKVIFAGMGEPLLHERIVDMIRQSSKIAPRIEIITNATLLDENMCIELIEAGLTHLWISIDDYHFESANNTNALKNIEHFNHIRKNKCKLGLSFVLVNPDYDDLKHIQALAKRLGADDINISQSIPCQKIDNLCYNEDFPVGKRYLSNIFETAERKLNYCPFVEESSVFIKWNGDIVPCMQLLHSSYTYLFDEKREVSAYSFGNIFKNNIIDIWNSLEYREFRERVRNFDFPDCTLCNGCDDRKSNRTDCMYNQMPTCGACLWAQNIARCP